MIDLKQIEALSARISGLLPADARLLQEEFKANLRPLLESALARMDLVTREEFDAQTRVLAHTRAKLERLEQQLAEFERDARVE
ncbi:MAG: accessory factor UbiK family protein [Gammaproteobacteria bacterium]|nr:accessory factor UbiK family protein [Gammaproteobacteria bacterium]